MQLGWIDFSKEDRQKAFDVINLLSEQGAVDELGIGVIRDAFANYFFPGTSTIQTRAKYFLIVPYMLRAKSFLCGIQAAFITLDIDMADELIRKRERSLKGAARAKLSRTKEFDHSKWVGGGMLDYRFSNARRIVNDIYAGEVSADV